MEYLNFVDLVLDY